MMTLVAILWTAAISASFYCLLLGENIYALVLSVASILLALIYDQL